MRHGIADLCNSQNVAEIVEIAKLLGIRWGKYQCWTMIRQDSKWSALKLFESLTQESAPVDNEVLL